jgi:hypothetical protein
MAKYNVLEPLSFVKNGKVVRYTHPAIDVQLDEAVAKKLGDKVHRSGEPEPEPESKDADAKPAPKAAEKK